MFSQNVIILSMFSQNEGEFDSKCSYLNNPDIALEYDGRPEASFLDSIASGTNVMIFKIFSPKNLAKKWRF
jgi:hypothetical protein